MCRVCGEGSCLAADESNSDGITQDNCNSNEFCNDTFGQCQPSFHLNECCDVTLDNCVNTDDEGNSLVCAPNIKYIADYFAVNSHYTCRPSCDTDDDCNNNNEWCAPLDESDPYSGRFCKEYKAIGDFCDVVTSAISASNQDLHTEERCDPTISYCHDPFFCLEKTFYYSCYHDFRSSCEPYGNACTNSNSNECNDPIKEWCDVSVGYCKLRYGVGECCTSEGSGDECTGSEELTCQLVTEELYNLGDETPEDIWWDISDAFPGSSICAPL